MTTQGFFSLYLGMGVILGIIFYVLLELAIHAEKRMSRRERAELHRVEVGIAGTPGGMATILVLWIVAWPIMLFVVLINIRRK